MNRLDPSAHGVLALQAVSFDVEPRVPSFRALFDAHYEYVSASLRRLGVSPGDLDDLTDEVFLRVHRALSSYDPKRPIRPWLFAFAFRVASDYRRLARHRFDVALEEDGHVDPGLTPEEALVRRQSLRLLDEALDAISVKNRAVFVMYEIEALEMKEIADKLGISVNTAYSRLRLARAVFEAKAEELREEERSREAFLATGRKARALQRITAAILVGGAGVAAGTDAAAGAALGGTSVASLGAIKFAAVAAFAVAGVVGSLAFTGSAPGPGDVSRVASAALENHRAAPATPAPPARRTADDVPPPPTSESLPVRAARLDGPPSRRDHVVSPSPNRSTSALPPVDRTPATAPIEASNVAGSPPEVPRAATDPPPASAEGPSAERPSPLQQERRLVDDARRALARNALADALMAADEHARSYPTGQLASEREAIAIQALARSGRHADVAARAARFRRTYPNHALTPIVDQAEKATRE